jgi:nucleotide-binding universal stress UspA family protein
MKAVKMNTTEFPQTDSPPRGSIFARSDYANRVPADANWVPSGIQLKNILVPLDFSERSLKALDYAEPVAKIFGAKITLLHVIEPPTYPIEMAGKSLVEQESQSIATGTLEGICESKLHPDVTAEAIVRHGFVFETIIEVAREKKTDLIITTTHGYTGLQHMLSGSAAECVVRHAPCPVLVVRDCEHVW